VCLTGEDGEEKTYSEFSDPCLNNKSAELSGIVKWMVKYPELCSITASGLESLHAELEARKLAFLNQFQSTLLPKVTYHPAVAAFLCTVRVPLGADFFVTRSRPCSTKKDAEADAARKWMDTHWSSFNLRRMI
jgi:hypothetical protein